MAGQRVPEEELQLAAALRAKGAKNGRLSPTNGRSAQEQPRIPSLGVAPCALCARWLQWPAWVTGAGGWMQCGSCETMVDQLGRGGSGGARSALDRGPDRRRRGGCATSRWLGRLAVEAVGPEFCCRRGGRMARDACAKPSHVSCSTAASLSPVHHLPPTRPVLARPPAPTQPP